ncbi:MAG: hypothetical protein RIR69_1481 [Actinomycetota bacterium]
MTGTLSTSRRKVTLGIAGLLALTLMPLNSVSASVSSAAWAPKDPPSIYDPNAGPNATRRSDPQNEICATDI